MAGNRVDVGRDRLEAAFRAHRKAAGSVLPGHSGLLLLVYAVECGLYALLMRARAIFHTSKLGREDDFKHDLARLIQQVRAETGIRGHLGSYTAEHPRGDMIHPVRLHSLLRYGGVLAQQDCESLLASLSVLAAEIEERLA